MRVVDIAAEGPAVVTDGAERVAPPPAGVVRWIDIEKQDEAKLALLGERFHFHPLALEDCLHFDQRAKLEEFEGYLFIVMHGFHCPNGDAASLVPIELHAFLGPGYLVTVHEEKIPALDEVWRRLAADAALGRRGPDFVYYLVADGIVDGDFAHVDRISEALDDLEEAVLADAQPRILPRLFQLKRTLVAMRRTISPQRDVFALLAKRGTTLIADKHTPYLRDVYDHLVRIGEAIESARDLLGNVVDAYLSMVAQRTNDVMKQLTILSAVFMPLTFVTGFFGQNFDALPQKSEATLYLVIAACVAIPAFMLLWFKWRRWI
jgi:magnesium transporter